EEVPADELAAVLGEDSLEFLRDSGVLEGADEVHSRFLLVSYLGRYFLASPPPGHPHGTAGDETVYIGPESLWLAKFVLGGGPYRTALDVCTGTGLLASLVPAREVVAV